MEIEKIVVGCLNTNCYILTKNNNCLIIDPGADFAKIVSTIGNRSVKGILITHHHFDHIGALKKIKKHYNIDVYDINNLDEGNKIIDDFNFEVIYTPGHTSDSISFYFKENDILFDGDFIFKHSIGRTDLKTGNIMDMKHSIDKIREYSNLTIYPGHGNCMTIEYVKRYNIYFD